MLIPRITLESSEQDFPFMFRRRQFPIRPAFVMTTNKSEGQTLQKAGVSVAAV